MMRRYSLVCLSVCIIGVAAIVPLQAQSFRTVAISRIMTGEESLLVNVDFAAGTLRIGPGDGRSLYSGQLYYDEDKFTPLTTFDENTNSLHFGLSPVDKSFNLGRIETPQRLSLTIAPQVPTGISATLGAAEAELELGGLSLFQADIKTGAAKASLDFSHPNRIACNRLTLKTGAAEFRAIGLGNSRCDQVSFAGGVGNVLLDFTGHWSDGSARKTDIHLGLGQLTIRLPRSVGVAIDVDRFLASFDKAGLEKAGSEYRSPDYGVADARLHITIEAVLGDIHIQWVEQ